MTFDDILDNLLWIVVFALALLALGALFFILRK